FHFQFYASANVPPNSGSGPLNAEEYLYRLLPNFDEIQEIRDAQDDDVLAIGIRTCGEMFGEREIGVPTSQPVSWMDTPDPGVADQLFVDASGNVVLRVPRAFVRLVETDRDRAVREDQTAAAFQFIAAIAGVPVEQSGSRFASLEDFKASGNQVRYVSSSADEQDGIGTTYHECGTLWMGTDPFESVTDVHGRFHHVPNAYACDQSLFPTSGSANPVPTGLALTRKIARGITKRYESGDSTIVGEDDFETLFDGTFDQWRSADAANFFSVPVTGQPTILGAGVDSEDAFLGVLWYEPERFGDFELRVQWRSFSPFANGGIFMRAPEPSGNLFQAGGFYDTALEVQIDERGFDPDSGAAGSPSHKTGSLYSRLPANRSCTRATSPRDGRPGFWNEFRIRIQGSMIEVRLNDEVVCQGTHGASLATGVIGLQCHT
ncbi:MAG: family 16 glycoside hydrolase, partial [Planctomycetota bacterium]